MADTEGGNTDMMRRIQSSFGTSTASIPKQNQLDVPVLNPNQIRGRHFSHFAQNYGGDASKRVGILPSHPNQIPPVSPYSQIQGSRPVNQSPGSQNLSHGPTHSRSLSQPNSFINLDSLPPLSPSPFRDSSPSDRVSTDVSMEDKEAGPHCLLPPSPFTRVNSGSGGVGEGLPPRKAHRRSNSDIPFGFNSIMQSSPSLTPLEGSGDLESLGFSKPVQLVKKESSRERGVDGNGERMGERKPEGEVVDDLFSAYMNLDNIDTLNSTGTDEKNSNENQEDLDSRASGTKTNGGESSDNEAESCAKECGNTALRAGMNLKRSAGGDIAPTSRHCRSVSMDSFMGKLNFADESPKLPPSPGARPGQLSPSGNSSDDNSYGFSLEFGNGEFSVAELKKIMANEKLAEIAMADPKRAKRILANRQSAARSKERKMRYMSELEHKVQTLQTEATTMSAQLTLLQRDFVGLANQNNELKFRLQAMEQQAQLRDALKEALTAEVRRLKLATQELSGNSDPSKGMASPQHHNDAQMFQLQQQQLSQLSIHQSPSHHHQQQQQLQNGNSKTTSESNQ